MTQPGKNVLADHQRKGSRFIPPLLQLGTFHDPRWRQVVVPEILWLALLMERHGPQRSAALALSLARAASHHLGKEKFLALTTSFAALSDAQQAIVRNSLRASGELDEIADGLLPLLVYYPACPLCFLFDQAVPILAHPQTDIERLKRLLASMYDRRSPEATWAQAHATYIAFGTDKLKVVEGVALANFPAIESYPNTEESLKIAASVRCTVSMMASHGADPDSQWLRYFWRRGLELQPCDLSAIHA